MGKDGEGVSRSEFIKLAAGVGLATGLGLAALSGTAEAAKKTKGPVRWGLLVDLRRCIGCKACAVACKAETTYGWVCSVQEWAKKNRAPFPRQSAISSPGAAINAQIRPV